MKIPDWIKNSSKFLKESYDNECIDNLDDVDFLINVEGRILKNLPLTKEIKNIKDFIIYISVIKFFDIEQNDEIIIEDYLDDAISYISDKIIDLPSYEKEYFISIALKIKYSLYKSVELDKFELFTSLLQMGNFDLEPFSAVAYYGGYKYMEYLYENNYTWNDSILFIAIKEDNVKFIKFLTSNWFIINKRKRYEKVENVFGFTMKFGNFTSSHLIGQIGKKIETSREHFRKYTLYNSIIEGSIECLKFLASSEKYGCNQLILCKIAAGCGNLEILKHLHSIGYQWNVETCNYATALNNLPCLKYAIENGCPVEYNAMRYAMENRNGKCLSYLTKKKCNYEYSLRNFNNDTYKLMDNAKNEYFEKK
jgi:hypothetical protein